MRRLDRYVTIYFLQAYFYCIAGFLSIVIVVAVNGIGTTLNGKFASVNSSLK